MGTLRDFVNFGTSPWALLFPPLYIAAWSISLFLPPDIKPPGTPAPELQLTQNEIGALIPDLLGTAKMAGNLLFYGNEYAIKRGSGSTKRYWYIMTWGLGFFVGEGETLYTIFLDEKVLWKGTLNKPGSGGKQSITGLSGFTDSGYHSGSIDVYFGTSDQVADAAIGTMNGDATLNSPYRGLFYMIFKNCFIGVNSKRMPNISIVVRKSPVYAFNAKNTVGIYDYNPMHAIWHIMTKLTGLPSTWLDTTDFSAVADALGDDMPSGFVLKASNGAYGYIYSPIDFNGSLYAGCQTGQLLKWNGVDAWVVMAAPYSGWTANHYMQSIIEFNGKIYGGVGGGSNAAPLGCALLEWNGLDAWVMVAPQTTIGDGYDGQALNVIIEFDGTIFGGDRFGNLVRWNLVDAWQRVALRILPPEEIMSLEVYNNELYGGTYKARLFKYIEGSGWALAAPQIDGTTYQMRSMKSFNGKLYGATRYGHLLEWNGVDAWSIRLPDTAFNETYQWNMIIYQGSLYVGAWGGDGYRWDGSSDAWENAITRAVTYNSYNGMVVFNNKIYATTQGGGLVEWYIAVGCGISVLLANQDEALNYISTILLHIKGILQFQSDGKFHPKLIRNDYDAGTLQLLDENDLIEPPVFKRKHWIDTLNEIKVQYSFLDRNAAVIDLRQSTADPVAVDMGNYNVQGRTVSKTIQYALFTTNKNAVWAGRLDLLAASYPFAVLQFKVNRNMFQLLPGDCFKFSYAANGISNMICRVLNISEEELESEDITIDASEDFYSISSAITEYTDPTTPSVVLPDYTIVYYTYQKVMETPYDMVVDPAIIEVLPVACPTSSLDQGFEFDISLDGGASYTMIDDMENLVPCGTLVAEYPSTTYTIDNITGFTIDFEYGAFQIMSCAFSQAISGSVNVGLLGNEIIFFQNITLVSGTQYKIDVVFRGRMDTAKQTHAIGTVFYFLGVNSESVTTSGLIAGVTRGFKLIPYNDLFYGTVAGATNINLALTGRAQIPYPPVNLTANSEGILPTYTADIVLAWSPRKRGYGAGTGIPGTILPDGTWEGLFEVEIWVSGTLKRTTSAINAITWTYTSAMNTSDNGSLAASVLCKVLNYRTVDAVNYESTQAEITCKKV